MQRQVKSRKEYLRDYMRMVRSREKRERLKALESKVCDTCGQQWVYCVCIVRSKKNE